jgi:hypothetical protein
MFACVFVAFVMVFRWPRPGAHANSYETAVWPAIEAAISY